MSARTDQIKAAVADARRSTNRGLGRPIDETPGIGTSILFEEFWQRHIHGPRCAHLTARPIQPSHLVPWDGTWRCAPCMNAWANRGAAQLRVGVKPLDPISDHSCDRCARYVSELIPTVVRQDMWVITCALCSRCVQWAQEVDGALSTVVDRG